MELNINIFLKHVEISGKEINEDFQKRFCVQFNSQYETKIKMYRHKNIVLLIYTFFRI